MKVSIVVPIEPGLVHSLSWALALRRLEIPCEYHVHAIRGFPIDVARNYGVKEALKEGSDYIFFLDSDVIPDSPQTLVWLLGWRLPVVSGVYRLKRVHDGSSFELNLFRREPSGYRPLRPDEVPRGHRLVEVDACGAGLLLVAREVFERLEEPWFKWELMPWAEGSGPSEDIYFCRRVREELRLEIHADLWVTARHVLGAGLAVDAQGRLVNVL